MTFNKISVCLINYYLIFYFLLRMSLAMFAATFDDNPSNEMSNNKIMPNNKIIYFLD